MNNKKYDWFAFRNETAARIIARMKTDHHSYYSSINSMVSDAVSVADALTLMLMETEDKLLTKIEEHEQKKKSRR
jgi:hypothetical protein